jgi:hypothetical protein
MLESRPARLLGMTENMFEQVTASLGSHNYGNTTYMVLKTRHAGIALPSVASFTARNNITFYVTTPVIDTIDSNRISVTVIANVCQKIHG